MNAAHEVAMALRAAYWAMHRKADAALEPHGATANQFVLLALLAEHDGVTQRELVERASSDANTVGAMLSALEDKGLVARERHPADARARVVTLTAAGRRARAKLWARGAEFRRRLLDALRPGEPEALVEMLGRLAAAMSRDDREAARAGAARGSIPRAAMDSE